MSDYKIGIPSASNTSLIDLRLQSEMRQLENLKQQSETQAGDQAVKEAARQFESLLIQQMLKSMWETVPEGGLLTGSKEEQHYRDMLNQAYADELSKGQGIGIKEVIYDDMQSKKSDPKA